MEFYICIDGSALKYGNAEDFINELLLEIEDAKESGATYFSIGIETDVS